MTQRKSISMHQARTAFSMIEMVLAIVILSIIVIGLQSATILASRVNSSQSTTESTRLASARAMEWLNSELSCATQINTNTATTIEFVTPDRTGDGVSDTIRYSWSGVAGAPLYRTINGASTSLVSGVREFDLQYTKSSQVRATTYTESAEITLASYDSILNIFDYVVRDGRFVGQYFKPSLPNNAVSWRVTRALLKLAKYSSDVGLTRVQLRKTSSGAPLTVVDEDKVNESSLLSSYTWKTFTFPSMPLQPAGGALCLVLQWESDTESCSALYGSLSLPNAGTMFISTSDGGVTWYGYTMQSLSYYIYGTYYTANPAVTDYKLTMVKYALRGGAESSNRITGVVRAMNQPAVTGP